MNSLGVVPPFSFFHFLGGRVSGERKRERRKKRKRKKERENVATEKEKTFFRLRDDDVEFFLLPFPWF